MDLSELWNLVRQVPSGKCTTYGALGAALPHPTSGRMVGRWMAQSPDDIPWWRVVNKRGELPIWKRNPAFADDQREKLIEEGVPFKEERVDLNECGWTPI